MADLVQSVRADFNEPALPFIISGPGMDGYGSRGKANICNAQRRAAERPEFNELTASSSRASLLPGLPASI